MTIGPIRSIHSIWLQPRFYVAVSFALWAACLFLPSIKVALQATPEPGGAYLIIGWVGPVGGHLEWYANPAMVVSSYYLLKHRSDWATAWALIALVLMCLLLFTGKILADEGGARLPIDGFLVGYWLWIASAVVLLIGASIQWFMSRRVA